MSKAEVGCDNKSINENVLAFCMKYILERIQISHSEIVEQLLSEIKTIQQNEPTVNTDNLRAEIDKLTRKKHKAIDLMLEELITKDDLREQTEFYDREIAKLTEEIALGQDVNSAHKKQLDGIKNYIFNQCRSRCSDSFKCIGTFGDKYDNFNLLSHIPTSASKSGELNSISH